MDQWETKRKDTAGRTGYGLWPACRQIGPVQEIVTGRYGRLIVQTTDGRSYDRHSERYPERSATCHVVVRDELILELTGTP